MRLLPSLCLSDLLPVVRWSRPEDLSEALGDSRLPDTWWESMALPRVARVVGEDWLYHRVTRLVHQHWDHVPLGDVLPALRALPPVPAEEWPGELSEALRSGAAEPLLLPDQTARRLRERRYPAGLGATDVIAGLARQVLAPMLAVGLLDDPDELDLPASTHDAARTVADWVPADAPEAVRTALLYLVASTDVVDQARPELWPDAVPPAEEPAAPVQAAPQPPPLPAPPAADHAPDPDTGYRAPADEPPARPDWAPADEPYAPHDWTPPAEVPESADAGYAEPVAEAVSGPQSGYAEHQGPPPRYVPPGALAPHAGHEPDSGPPTTFDTPAIPADAEAPPVPAAHRPEDPEPAPSAEPLDPLVRLIDTELRRWDDAELRVATERLFAAEPVGVTALSQRLGMDPAALRTTQRSAESRLLTWLNSPEAADMAEHLAYVTELLGTASTLEHMQMAHPAHSAEVPVIGIPVWRVLVSLTRNLALHDGWLVAGDVQQLRQRTRELLSQRPSVTEAGALLDRLGIGKHAARAWILSTPGLSIRNGEVINDDPSAPEPPPLSDVVLPAIPLPVRRRRDRAALPTHHLVEQAIGVADSARCFRVPEGTWWHRIDITAEHLDGRPIAVPAGFADHLGLRQGQLLSVLGPHDEVIVFVWQDEPVIDSLAPLLGRMEVRQGDRVFVSVREDRLDARVLPGPMLAAEGTEPVAAGLALSGYTAPATLEEAVRVLAQRIGCTEPVGPAELTARLAQRGDNDILSRLQEGLRVAEEPVSTGR
ncbi:hypothetical protein [Allonocardiopsis opalescens]|uniref:Uncharacterized protein n=1 Tax=Allonocardiopsis opalescens TaxID=1144618 RepID=A0A2T0QAC6_9ACTN|nr:hypothetical protein [Allonocardiopsis opalescens]PRY00866.1 hypothetical protein CLV72_102498 [Allonocardiopsis opalescens]